MRSRQCVANVMIDGCSIGSWSLLGHNCARLMRAAEFVREMCLRQMEGGIFANTVTPTVFEDPRPQKKIEFVLKKNN